MLAARALVGAVGPGLRMDVIAMWGTLFRARGTTARGIGIVFHFVASASIGVAYAVAFQVLGVRSSLWLWGLLGALVHWLIGGLFLAVVPPIHPEITEREPAPGAFARYFGGGDIVAFLVQHLAYGVVTATTYGLLEGGGI
jgi:hypothetical protein